MDSEPTSPFWLGACLVDPLEGLVTTRTGESSLLQKKPMAVLLVLVAAAGRVVPSDHIIETVWGRHSGGDEGLKRCIYAIRKSLGDSSTHPCIIRTVRGRGYACVPIVSPVISAGDAPPLKVATADRAPQLTQNRLITIVSIAVTTDDDCGYDAIQALPDALLKEYEAALDSFAGAYPYQLSLMSNILFGLHQTRDDDHLAALDLAQTFREITRRHNGFCTRIGIATVETHYFSLADVQQPIELDIRVIRSAATIAASANPHEIVLCDATMQLCARHINGLSGNKLLPNCVRQLRRDTAAPSVRYIELLGRDIELAVLLDCWSRVSNGQGVVCFVSGDAGIGKSTLCEVFVQKVMQLSSNSIVQCACQSRSTHISLHPILDLATHTLGLHTVDTDFAKIQVIEDRLPGLGFTDPISGLVLAEFLQLDVQIARQIQLPSSGVRRNMLMEIFSRMLLNPAGDPHLLIFDDIQWADATTVDLLERLVEQVSATQTMLLVIARSESHPSWINRPHVRHINLSPIDSAQAARIVQRIDNDKLLDDHIIGRITAQAAGNPLFVEEITKTILARRNIDEAMEHILSMPVRQLLNARVDALGEERIVLLHASVIGFQFNQRLLEDLMGVPRQELEGNLKRLCQANMIHQIASYPMPAFEFNHSLLQAAVYQSIAASTLKSLHRTLAELIECAEEQHDRNFLAIHFEAGGEHEKASHYWLQSAYRAKLNSFLLVANDHYERAAVTISRLNPSSERDELELKMRIEFGPVLMSQKGYAHERVRENYLVAEKLAGRLLQRGSESVALALFGLWSYKVVNGDLHQAKSIGENLIELALIHENKEWEMEASLLLGVTQTHLGEYDEAVVRLRNAISLYGPLVHAHHKHLFGQDPGMAANVYCGLALAQCGNLIEANAYFRQGLIIARRCEHANSLCFALVITSRTAMAAGDLDTMAFRAREAQTLAAANEFPLWESAASFLIQAHDYLKTAEPTHVYLMLDTLKYCRELGNSLSYLDFASTLANALIDIGDYAEAKRIISAAKAELDRRITCSDEIAVRAAEHRLLSLLTQKLP